MLDCTVAGSARIGESMQYEEIADVDCIRDLITVDSVVNEYENKQKLVRGYHLQVGHL